MKIGEVQPYLSSYDRGAGRNGNPFLSLKFTPTPPLAEGNAAFVEQYNNPALEEIPNVDIRLVVESFDKACLQEIPSHIFPLRVSSFRPGMFADALGLRRVKAYEFWREVKKNKVVHPEVLFLQNGSKGSFLGPDHLRLLKIVSHALGELDDYKNVAWEDVKKKIKVKLGNHRIARLISIGEAIQVQVKTVSAEPNGLDSSNIPPWTSTMTIVADLNRDLRKAGVVGQGWAQDVRRIPPLSTENYQVVQGVTASDLENCLQSTKAIADKQFLSVHFVGLSRYAIRMIMFIAAVEQKSLNSFDPQRDTVRADHFRDAVNVVIPLLLGLESKLNNPKHANLPVLFSQKAMEVDSAIRAKMAEVKA